MIVSSATAQALEKITERESELRAAFTPGAQPTHPEITAAPSVEADRSPLSVAPDGNAYFVVRDPNGGEAFTRDGVFHIDGAALVDRDGTPVLGFQRGGALRPLRLDPIDSALGRIRNVRIENDGALTYEKSAIDPVTRQPQRVKIVAGRLALARFSAATRLEPIGDTYLRAPAGIPPHVGTPADGNFLPLITHAHLRSGIDLLTGIDRLQESYMAFDALRAAHSAEGRTEKIAMDLLK